MYPELYQTVWFEKVYCSSFPNMLICNCEMQVYIQSKKAHLSASFNKSDPKYLTHQNCWT